MGWNSKFVWYEKPKNALFAAFLLVFGFLVNNHVNEPNSSITTNYSSLISSSISESVKFATLSESSISSIFDEEIVDEDEDETNSLDYSKNHHQTSEFHSPSKDNLCTLYSARKTRLYILYNQIKIAHS